MDRTPPIQVLVRIRIGPRHPPCNTRTLLESLWEAHGEQLVMLMKRLYVKVSLALGVYAEASLGHI